MTFRSQNFKHFKRKNKYNAQRTASGDRYFDSRFESKVAADLEWKKKAGEIVDIQYQYKIEIRVKGILWRNYKVDFRVELANGTIQYIEAKGFARDDWAQKWDLLHILKDEILEPGAELILITQK